MYKIFDKLEDYIRGFLSHYPIWYALVGGTGLVIFWRGIWHSMDYIVSIAHSASVMGSESIQTDLVWWDGPLSLIIGILILLSTGLFVSNFIGNEIILSGLRGEKKISEKSEHEIEDEAVLLHTIEKEVRSLQTKTKPRTKKK